MHRSSGHIKQSALDGDIEAYRDGDDAAGDRLATVIRPAVLLDVSRFLGAEDPEVEDIVQDSIVASLRYLRRRKNFQGKFVRLCVTIARNRCRDLYRYRRIRPQTEIESHSEWLASPERSVLDELEERQIFALLQEGLDMLQPPCDWLLHSLYVQRQTLEQVKSRLGVGTVQGALYRREVCLGKLKFFLLARIHGRSEDTQDTKRRSPRPSGVDTQ